MSSENMAPEQATSTPAATPIDGALAHLRAVDPVIGHLIDIVGPFALQRDPGHFYALLSSIVSQQISVRAAATIMARVEALFSTREEMTPAAVLAMGAEPLRAAGLSGMKTRYVLDLAERVASGRLDLDRLAELDDEDVISQLVQVKGIGRWTAEMHLIFGLSRLDVLPVDDLGFRAAVKRRYGLPDLPSREESRAIGAVWTPYRTVATWYLWRSLGAAPRGGAASGEPDTSPDGAALSMGQPKTAAGRAKKRMADMA